MGQAFWQAMQRLHSSLTRRLKTPSGEIRLSKAPRGQRYRHQNRGDRRLRAITAPKITSVRAVM